MSGRFIFDLRLGEESVKRVVFPGGRGRRELKTSGGYVIGEIVLTPGGLRLDLEDYAAQTLVDAQFDTDLDR